MGRDMKLKKLKAARAKWLENQQARERPNGSAINCKF